MNRILLRSSMKRSLGFLLAIAVVGCARESRPSGQEIARQSSSNDSLSPADAWPTLSEARNGFQTRLVRKHKANEPVEQPPRGLFQVVQYDSPVGKLGAYITPDSKDGKKRPAIIWITGGDCNTIGDVWSPADPRDDQTARQYRDAGLVMMFPSLRGGNQNPGVVEGFFGEVDDVIAAADFLAKQPHVDPRRIYLGGHSTGGTLVLLVAESTDRFRSVFSFGPADEISHYPTQFIPGVNTADSREVELRSPVRWLSSIRVPTFVFEGTVQGNLPALQAMKQASNNPKLHIYPVKGRNHFDVLAPVNSVIAQKILKDDGEECQLSFTEAELNRAGR